ncbi:choice-of-anchor Q domain-containing protein [Solirubrobacter soli]|uniref:choice-of-anchor Q domain-containing protein n=1 Tax=Solirubrobacter soli TaxID=363832 RepID=UPI0004251C26|nr:choice-of-anchor Q domain-containing protein [Solirubrobacter soli]
MRWNGILATTVAALLAFAAPAAADTYVVNTIDDDTGTCATSCSIRQAVVSAEQNPGPDTIQIPAGEYALTQGPLQLTTEVTITGADANQTYLYAAQGSRVFQIASTTAAISRLTMAGGTATAAAGYFGGNLLAQSSTVMLDHVRVTGGSAYSGGGLGNRNGTMTISNSLLAHNAANQGGSDGGAIVNFGGDGGAAANLAISNTTIAYNSAGNTGAINQWGNDADRTTLVGTTVAYNTANGFTGGINAQGTISVRNSLLAGNTVGSANSNCGAGIVSLGYNVDDGGTTCNFDGTGDVSDANAHVFPELVLDGGDTEVLQFDRPSPAMDIGGTCSPTDQVGHPRSAACDAGAWEYQAFRFLSVPDGPSNHAPTFTWGGPYSSYYCSIVEVPQSGAACTSPYTVQELADGTYTLEIEAPDDATITQTFTIDKTAPSAPGVSDGYEFSSEPGAKFECSLNGAPYAACASPYSTAGLGAGEYTLAVRAVDAAGNASTPTTRAFTIGSTQPAPTPTATPTPSPEPVLNKSVEAEPQGTVLIKDPKTGKFVPLKPGVIPNGSEIDATRGSVTITTSTGEKATFSDGRFKISQSGGITTATLSQPLDCKKAKKGNATATAKKPKSRKLWGDGKGKFRTKGSYSAATVRGTKWLVQDTCTTTLTRVAQGVVQVEDFERHVKKTLRKGKSYIARAKKK